MNTETQEDKAFSHQNPDDRAAESEGKRFGRASNIDATRFDEDVDVRNLFLIFWRRKILLVGLVTIGAVLSLFVSSKITPIYQSQAYILLQAEHSDLSEFAKFVTGKSADPSLILSEIQIIKSRTFARKVVDELNLDQDPLFEVRPSAGNNEFMHFLKPLYTFLGIEFKPEKENQNTSASPAFKSLRLNNGNNSAVQNYDIKKELVINKLVRQVQAKAVGGSNVIIIEVKLKDPQKAALIANAYADLYLKERIRIKFDSRKKLTNWLDQRLDELRAQVRESQIEVERYKVENNLISSLRGDVIAQQLTEFNSQLIRAKAELAANRSKLREIQDNKDKAKELAKTPEILNSSLIQRLKQQEIDLIKKRADLKTKFGPKHPAIKDINAELKSLRENIIAESIVILSALEQNVKIDAARVQALEDGLNDLLQVKAKQNTAMIKLQELQLDAEANLATYNSFLKTYKESDQREQLQEPEARIISYATIPLEPIYPNKPLFASLASAVMLFLGIVLCLLLEKLDNAFRNASQLEDMTGFPCFGILPKVKGKKEEIVRHVIDSPSSLAAEHVRNLRTVLGLRLGKGSTNTPKIITVTSSLPSEGKSTLSAWLGQLSAVAGLKTLVIDCDLRRPNINNLLPQNFSMTLVDYLTGEARLEDIIYTDEQSGVDIIYGRSVPGSAMDLISSARMKKMIAELRQEYSFVILDAPSCLYVSDARILSTLADHTLYVVAWEKTERDTVALGIKQYTDIDYQNLSTVLSGVDVKKQARYGFGHYDYYYQPNAA